MAVSDFGSSVSDVRCRPAGAEDLTFLAAMLGEAAVWRPDKQTPTGDEVLADPRVCDVSRWVAAARRPWTRRRTRRASGCGVVSDVHAGEPWLRLHLRGCPGTVDRGHRVSPTRGNWPSTSRRTRQRKCRSGLSSTESQCARTESRPRPVRVGRLRHHRQGRIVLDNGPTRRSITLSHAHATDHGHGCDVAGCRMWPDGVGEPTALRPGRRPSLLPDRCPRDRSAPRATRTRWSDTTRRRGGRGT